MRLEDKHEPPLTARPEAIGSARLEGAETVVADSCATVTLVYTAGTLGIDDGGRIRVAFRYPNDCEALQFEDEKAANYCSVSSSRDVKLTPSYDPFGGIRPFWKVVDVMVTHGSLAPGDEIRVVFGDRKGGSAGWRMQTFAEKRSLFLVLADPMRTGIWEALSERLAVEIVSGEAEKVVPVLSSEVGAGEQFELFLRVEDRWGNPARGFEGEVRLEGGGGIENLPERVKFDAQDRGCKTIGGLVAPEPGVVRVGAKLDGAGPAVSNTAVVRARQKAKEFVPFWGDLHAQSGETVGAGSITEYLDYARTSAHLDFCSHQGNCFQISDEKWAHIVAEINKADDPGKFTAFPGYEYSPNEHHGGDHNIVFLDDKQPLHRAMSWLAEIRPRDEGVLPASALYEKLDPERALVSHHIGGRPGNLDYFGGEELEPFVEVHSCWGTFEWFWKEALERGLKVGFVCGSDDHKCRPGAAHPGRSAWGSYGGLVCAYARELARKSIWEALKARRVYGTTGARIGVWFSCEGVPMGGEVRTAGAPEFDVGIAGSAGIEFIELWCAKLRPPEEKDNIVWRCAPEPVRRFVPWDESERGDDVLRVSWGGASKRGRRRAAVWDGHLEVEGTRILDVQPYGFAPPNQGAEYWDERTVRWHSTTTGGRYGVRLALGGWRGRMKFHSPLHEGVWPLDEVTRGAKRAECGGVDLHVEVARLPKETGCEHVKMVMADRRAREGEHAYCLRIAQVDGQMAWTSPIFVAAT